MKEEGKLSQLDRIFDRTQDNNVPSTNEDPFEAENWGKVTLSNKAATIKDKSVCFLRPNEGKLKKKLLKLNFNLKEGTVIQMKKVHILIYNSFTVPKITYVKYFFIVVVPVMQIVLFLNANANNIAAVKYVFKLKLNYCFNFKFNLPFLGVMIFIQ